jgi:hypothetical protein
VVGAETVSTGALKAGEFPVEGIYYDFREYYSFK